VKNVRAVLVDQNSRIVVPIECVSANVRASVDDEYLVSALAG
jgi:hypothetical protein